MYELDVSIGKFSRRNTLLLVLLCNLFTAYTIEAQGVISVSPAQNALNVPRNSNITVTFNEQMDTSTFADSSIRVWGNQTGLHVSTFSYDSAAYTLIIDPSVDFLPSEVATITLTNNIHTVGGQPSARFVWQFKTIVNPSSARFLRKNISSYGSEPYAIGSADFDRDGDIDLVVINYSDDNLVLLLNNGGGTFLYSGIILSFHNMISIGLADMNNDTYIDLIVGHYDRWSPWKGVSILKNRGDGTFQGLGSYETGSYIYSIYANDLDSDGDIDFGLGSSILKNNGDGTFQLVGIGGGYSSGAGADLDLDGDVDFATAIGNSVHISKNNGDATFQIFQSLSFPVQLTSIASSDLDNDGGDDLAVTGGDSVYILKNNGIGTFQTFQSYIVGNSAQKILLQDIDGNGTADIVVQHWLDTYVSVLKNNGDATFQKQVTYTTGTRNIDMTGADLDSDGDIDFAVTSGDITLLINGPILISDRDSIIFKPTYIGSVSDTSFMLINFFTDSITVSNITTSNNKFLIVGGTNFELAAGDTHIVVVRYTPTITQIDTGTLSIFPSGYPIQKVSLRGTGKTPVAIINVTPTSLSFGSTPVGKISDLILNIRNIGQPGLSVTNITHSNNHFSITGPISFTVLPGETYPIMAAFFPDALGSLNDELSISSNDSVNNPLNISITGSGTATQLPEISIFPLELRFDSITVGQSDTVSLRVNNLGAATLNVTGMSTTNNAYSVLTANSFALSAGDSIDALIRFTPTQAGRQEEFLTISSNDANENPLTIRLTNARKILVSVESNERQIPESYFLFQNYPNPFNPMTTINVGIPKASYVTLKVYNILGQEVAALVDGEMRAGMYNVQFNAEHLGSGVYFYRIQAREFVETKKLLIIR